MNKSLFLFELKRFVYNRLFIGLVLVILVICAGDVVYLQMQAGQYMMDEGIRYTNLKNYADVQARGLSDVLVDFKDGKRNLSSDDVKLITARLDYFEVERIKLALIAQFYKDDNPAKWTQLLGVKNLYYENIIRGQNDLVVEASELKRSQLSWDELDQTLMYNKYLLGQENFKYRWNPLEQTAATAVLGFFRGDLLLGLILVLGLISISFYHLELSEGSYKLVCHQPVSRSQLFRIKWLVVLLTGLGVFLAILTARFGVGLYFGGLGDWFYPLKSGMHIFHFSLLPLGLENTIIPTWQYLALAACGYLFLYGFVQVAVFAIAVFTDEIKAPIAGLVLLLGGGYISSHIIPDWVGLSMYWPMSYAYFERVLEGYRGSNYGLGLLLNGMGIVMFYWAARARFLKKDFLGERVNGG